MPELQGLVTSRSDSEPQASDWTVGVVFAVVGTFLFALKSIFIKLAYLEGATVDEVLLLRMLLAAPFYLGMLIYLRRKSTQANHSSIRLSHVLKMMALGFMGYYLASYLDLAGLVYITAQLERLTLFTYPTMIAILAWLFLGEAITRMIIISLIFCYLGLWIMYGQEIIHTDLTSNDVTKGVLLVLGSALSYSIYVIFAKPMIQKFGSRFFTSIAMLGSTIFVIIHFCIQHRLEFFQISSKVWIYAILLAFVSTVIPSFMIAEAISRIGAARTSILGTAGPVFTIILAVFIIDEPFTIYHAVGILLVMVGVACISSKKLPAVK